MMGTLAGVLAAKGIRTPEENFWADVQGDIEDVDGVLKITQIHVLYHLRIPSGAKQAAEEALAAYLERCPAAQSVMGCIRIRDWAEIEEVDESR
jgi:hypothetical protein